MKDIIKSVLIVEDEALLQDALRMILESQGYRVEVAPDGMKALQMLKERVPDLILLDYFMPRMDGKNFLENYDASLYPRTKVVVTSNISDPSVEQEMLSLGAHKYVLKASLSPTELLGLVEEMLQ